MKIPKHDTNSVKKTAESPHDFHESSGVSKYDRVMYCKNCGQVSWNFNYGRDMNIGLQDRIKPCVQK